MAEANQILIDPDNPPTAQVIADALAARRIGKGLLMDCLGVSHTTAGKILNAQQAIETMEYGRVVKILKLLRDTEVAWDDAHEA